MIAQNQPQDDGCDEPKLLTVKDLSTCLRISVRQCWRLGKKGLLPAPICIGTRIIRWNASEIAAWLRAGSPPRSAWELKRDTELTPIVEDATCE